MIYSPDNTYKEMHVHICMHKDSYLGKPFSNVKDAFEHSNMKYCLKIYYMILFINIYVSNKEPAKYRTTAKKLEERYQ